MSADPRSLAAARRRLAVEAECLENFDERDYWLSAAEQCDHPLAQAGAVGDEGNARGAVPVNTAVGAA